MDRDAPLDRAAPMDRDELWDRVDAALDAGLDPLEDPEVVTALHADPAAADAFARLQLGLDALRGVPRDVAPARPRPRRVAIACAGAALCLVVGAVAWMLARGDGETGPRVATLADPDGGSLAAPAGDPRALDGVPPPPRAVGGRVLSLRVRIVHQTPVGAAVVHEGTLVEEHTTAARFVAGLPGAGSVRLERTVSQAVPRSHP